jgi:hypothetical protein
MKVEIRSLVEFEFVGFIGHGVEVAEVGGFLVKFPLVAVEGDVVFGFVFGEELQFLCLVLLVDLLAEFEFILCRLEVHFGEVSL